MEGEVLTTRLPGKSLNSFNKKVLHKKFFENSGVIKIKEAEIIAKTAAAAKSLQLCPTLRPQRWQPTRLPRPWDSPGRNTGVGCHFLLQCMKVKVKSFSCARLLATPWTAAYHTLKFLPCPRSPQHMVGCPSSPGAFFPVYLRSNGLILAAFMVGWAF